jgi:hypothetical protein
MCSLIGISQAENAVEEFASVPRGATRTLLIRPSDSVVRKYYCWSSVLKFCLNRQLYGTRHSFLLVLSPVYW